MIEPLWRIIQRVLHARAGLQYASRAHRPLEVFTTISLAYVGPNGPDRSR